MSSKITKLRKETADECIEILGKYHKCAIVRPTGFGKTGILTGLLKKYKKVLYFYPSSVVKKAAINFYNLFTKQSVSEIPNVTFMTYSRLLRLGEEDYETLKGVDLIITDECHRLGAEKTKVAITKLIGSFPDADLLGATATPERMDLIDEISMFFDNHVVSRYTLHDAFQDKILQKPHYCFCSYTADNFEDLKHEIRMEVDKLDDTKDRKNMEAMLSSRLIEISNLTRMDNVIKTTCDACVKNTDTMKFIVFCSSFAHLHDTKDKVEEWFKSAYPNHSVCSLIVSSEKSEYRNNVENLSKEKNSKRYVELIFCCDMLNLGYHVNDITGIIMYRGTESGIVFAQQLGRVLSSGDTNSKLVFDLVDNIHRESVYDSIKHRDALKKTRITKLNKLLEKKAESEQNSNVTFSEEEEAELTSLKKLLESNNEWWHEANSLEATDLIATSHMATYRELIAKTVAEPISMRSRQAWARWIEKGGDPRDMTAVEILKQQAPDAVPLAPFCHMKQVTVKNVLETMGVKN